MGILTAKKSAIVLAGLAVLPFLVFASSMKRIAAQIDPMKLQTGEVAVVGETFSANGITAEVLGVCSVSEEELSCWKPNGTRDQILSKQVGDALAKSSNDYLRTFQFRYGMKNRLLVMKKSHDRQTSVGYVGPYFLPGVSYDAPGWKDNGQLISQIIPQSIDEAMVETRFMIGSFQKSSTTFPFRYQVVGPNLNRKSIPFKVGKFSIGGNDYVLDSISDSPDPKEVGRYGSGSGNKVSAVYIKVHAEKIGDPNSILTMYPADERGRFYAGTNMKDEPIFSQEFGQLMGDQAQKDIQAQKDNIVLNQKDRFDVFAHMINPIQFDVTSPWEKGVLSSRFTVELSKVKTLDISTQKRSIFVFQNIRLDPR